MRAGAESVEHAVDLDDSTLTEMAARGTYYVPTIDHNRYYAENREQFGYTPEQAAALDAYRARNIETARRAFKAHVRFAMGSDAVFTMFGQNTRELGWFTQIGIVAATLSGLFGASPEAATACAASMLLVTFLGVIPLGLIWAQFEHVSLRKVTQESEVAEEVAVDPAVNAAE